MDSSSPGCRRCSKGLVSLRWCNVDVIQYEKFCAFQIRPSARSRSRAAARSTKTSFCGVPVPEGGRAHRLDLHGDDLRARRREDVGELGGDVAAAEQHRAGPLAAHSRRTAATADSTAGQCRRSVGERLGAGVGRAGDADPPAGSGRGPLPPRPR